MLWTNERTLRTPVETSGIGLHTGKKIELTIRPAPEGHGVVFVRTDLSPHVELPARAENVVDTSLATTLGVDHGGKPVRVGTVEHLLSALYGLGIDNARVEVNGPELPIMDGSAAPFVFLLQSAGIRRLSRYKKFLRVKKPVEVREGDKIARITPSRSFKVTCAIEFDHPLIQRQQMAFEFSDRAYYKEIARARTFGFLSEVRQMQSMGLARGGSLENAIVIDEFSIMNEGGLRFADEFVRHKVLDTVGDLALLGMQVIGHVQTSKSGHALNHQLTLALLADPSAYEVLEVREEKDLGRLDVALPAFGLAEAL